MTTHAAADPFATPEPALSISKVHGAELVAVEGEEHIGRVSRLGLTFALGGEELDPAEVVGAPARLEAAGRVFGGVVAELEAGEAGETGRRLYRATLAPRAWLLSRGRRSRFFERLSTPEIVEVVVSASGLDLRVERRLRDAYPARACTVQHRESDSDFVCRLLEKDGICLVVEDDGERCTLTLSDHNEALPHAGEIASASGLRRKGALLPNRVELVSLDPARPELPLRATAIVSETGVGDVEVHDVAFTTPEEGARAARLYAEWLRGAATITHGEAKGALAAGRRARVFGREVVLATVRHAFSRGAGWTSRFEATASDVPVRPERRTKAPRVLGLQGGRLAARDVHSPRARGEDGLYRVRDAASAVDRVMPLASAGAAVERELAAGTQVVWGCIDGDPDLPVITAVLDDAAPTGRAVLRGPGGSMLELAGAAAKRLGDVDGLLAPRDGGAARVPEVAHHAFETESDTAGTGATDTWMRLAVPHTATKTWSYLRIGEQATDSVSGNGSSFTENEATCGKLTLNAYDATNLSGSFDFTNKNRTSITNGKWEQIVRGDGRLAIYSGEDTPAYELSVTPDSRDDKSVHVTWGGEQFNYTSGATATLFAGAAATANLGYSIQALIGGSLAFTVGMANAVTVGYTTSIILADSYEYRRGEQLSSASTVDQRAKEKIQFSVHSGGGGFSKEMGVALAMTLAGGAITAGGAAAFDGAIPGDFFHKNTKEKMATLNGIVGGVELLAFILMRALSKERDLEDGNPILSLDKSNMRAALRSDDWLLLMDPSFAVLGKNKPYLGDTGVIPAIVGEVAVTNLTLADAGTAVVLEENNKITIQGGKTTDKMATIVIDKKGITITADTFELKGTSADSTVTITGPVTIDGDVTLKKTLTVDGESTFNATMTGPSGNEIQ